MGYLEVDGCHDDMLRHRNKDILEKAHLPSQD